jgi:hypothetical protein
METLRVEAWHQTKGDLKVTYNGADAIVPQGWPADCTAEEAAFDEAGLMRDGKRVATGEAPAEMPEQVPSSGTFLHALLGKR